MVKPTASRPVGHLGMRTSDVPSEMITKRNKVKSTASKSAKTTAVGRRAKRSR